jgi:hypothetical protein
MALLGNYSVLNKNPGRAFGGSTVSDTRAQSGKSGPARGRFVGYAGYSPLAATPNGYLPPYSWVMPQKAGGIASYTIIVGTGVLTANIAGGRNAEATLSGSGDITNAEAALIVSAVATLTGSGLITDAAANAYLNAAADLAGAGSITAAMTALGWAVTTINGTGTLTASTGGSIGSMSATITPFTDLSPQSLATAVWSAVSSGFADPATFGGQANFLYLLAHNKVVTDPTTGTMRIYAADDTTVLYTASLWENAAGSLPYDGAGAERRDKFA